MGESSSSTTTITSRGSCACVRVVTGVPFGAVSLITPHVATFFCLRSSLTCASGDIEKTRKGVGHGRRKNNVQEIVWVEQRRGWRELQARGGRRRRRSLQDLRTERGGKTQRRESVCSRRKPSLHIPTHKERRKKTCTGSLLFLPPSCLAERKKKKKATTHN